MFYDPMIAKLCTWAPTRAEAIDAMSDALDSFVVDGIEHNMPFLAALMRHPRWRDGRLSTGFIAEEYPDGFAPIVPDDDDKAVLAAVATAVELVRRDRLDRLSGRLAPHSGAMKTRLGGAARRRLSARRRSRGRSSLSPFDAEPEARWRRSRCGVQSDWRPARRSGAARSAAARISAQIRPGLNGIRIAWQGMSVEARVMLPRSPRSSG